MKAKDVMSTPAITASPSAMVGEVALVLAKLGISAVPVVDDDGNVIGIVSEGDLLRRKEIGTKKRRSWWLELLTCADTLAEDYTKAHSRVVRDLMKAPVISVSEDASLAEVADILEEHKIKRVTVMRDGKLVGVVSRGDLVRALAHSGVKAAAHHDDKSIRNTFLQRIEAQPWASASSLNFVVENGVVELNGVVASAQQHQAIRVLAETIPGVATIKDRLVEMRRMPTGI